MSEWTEHSLTNLISPAPVVPPLYSIGAWDWDVPRDRVYLCGNAADFFGLDRLQAAEGLSIEAVMASIHRDDFARVSSAICTARDQGTRYCETYRVRRVRSVDRRLYAFGGCTLNQQGQPLRFSGVVIDVTDFRFAEPSSAFDVACDNLLAARTAAAFAHDDVLIAHCDRALLHIACVSIFAERAVDSLS